ncbi:TGA transcription factor [Parasponia andersonii]|uniref:TGA transcription factor n=1 Tax=Parasponia andersonii TaxID=3476 RepID=A0A2P5BQW8_PARAD|nr:TGA transcription factor [Parasponia andersonii]
MASSNDDNGGSFASFLEGWLVRQEHYLDELVSADRNLHESSDDDLRELVSRILAHYQQYYEEKSRIAARDVFLVFSPPWFTSLERAFLWIAGFKPGLAFRIVADSVGDLSEDQARSIGRLVQETRTEERALNDELAKIQESVAAPPLLGIAMRGGRRLVDGEQDEADSALESLKVAMEAVLSAADSLRTRTALKIMEVLRPAQCVKFLLAAGQLQLRLRTWGLERE